MIWLLIDERGGLITKVADPKIFEMAEKIASAHSSTLAGTYPEKSQWAALRSRAVTLRDSWPKTSESPDALAAGVVETAAWPESDGAGRVAEEALNAYLRLAEGVAAA